ncbi:hypothetical protein MBLNU230_g1919t2 [Neophaeotheca triangularis]
MPAVAEILARRAGISLDIFEDSEALLGRDVFQPEQPGILEKRIEIPCCNESSPPGLVEATTVDPFRESSKYALGWVYFAIILLVATTLVRFYHLWTDKIRVAMHKEEVEQNMQTESPDTDYELSALSTDKSTKKFFPREGALPSQPPPRQSTSSSSWMNRSIALVRYVFYRPIPHVSYRKGWRPIFFPSLGIIVIVFAALVFTILYSFVPQPLYWEKIRYGSPPLAVRSGMLAVSLMPWIVGLSMKANFISMMTGIGHERLNVLHRWLAYICLLLSLIHTIPFYVQPVWDQGGLRVFRSYFTGTGVIIYGTGVAALVPLIFLCVHSLPPLRRRFYELFVAVHVPVSIVLLGMLFWHCNNYISSWHYLYSTVAIWLASYAVRLIYLNWTNPFRMSWLIGEEAGVTIMPEDAIKVTIPTQVKWRPGQYVYLRMPGISIFENHPFTIASLCSDDFPSAYGDEYRDMVLVFRPFGGFTNKVLKSALDHGPWHTYRTFIDGPYGGMARSLDSFDHVVLLAGGSGVTAVISHLLDLIKRMRDGKAVTKTVQVIWALKRPETMEWFKEELRICREFAPPDAVTCQFYITSAKRQTQTGKPMSVNTPTRPVSMFFHDQVNNVFQNIASNRFSTTSTQRHSALIQAEANGDPEREKELRKEEQDRIRPLPQAHLMPMRSASRGHLSASPNRGSQDRSPARSASPDNAASQETPHMPPHPTLHEKRRSRALTLDITSAQDAQAETLARLEEGHQTEQQQQGFDFGFPSTPTEFQKNLMRFAFMPAAVKSKKTGWSTEWGRPDIPYMLRDMSEDWTGRRACVFVCGPPAMRVDVGNTVAELQKGVWKDKGMDEVFLHTENYAL